MAEDPIHVVRRFCESWSTHDLDKIMSGFTDDAVWHNMPLDPVNGADAVRTAIAEFLDSAGSVDFRIDHIAAQGDTVLTERVDIMEMQGRAVELPVMGTFEVRDGRIARWRDYFDMRTFRKLSQG
jgi:limonene-1,2-epoxide hydrolase